MIGADLADAAVELVRRLRQLERDGVNLRPERVRAEVSVIATARSLSRCDVLRLRVVGSAFAD